MWTRSRVRPTCIAEATWDTLKNTLTLTLKGCYAVVVGKSATVQCQSNRCDLCSHGGQIQSSSFDGKKVQTTSDSKIVDSSIVERTEMSAKKSTNIGLTRETQQHLNEEHGAQCEQVLKKLELLQNKGKLNKDVEHLFSLYSRLCRERENADMEISLVIEQGVSFMYQKEFKKSKLFLTSVIDFGSYCQLRNPAILIARANFLLVENHTHMYDKDKKIQFLLKCLEHSEDLLQHHDSPED
ncbi:hypothetical protein ACROYT_G041104 [Oculina patagonica]